MRIVILIISLLLSVVTYQVLIKLQTSPTEKAVNLRDETIYVVALNSNKPSGSTLTLKDLKWRSEFLENIVVGSITSKQKSSAILENLTGKTLLVNAFENQQILRQNITNVKGGFLSRQLKEGYRAYSIKVNPISAVGGFVIPGDVVDIISTRKIDLDEDGFAEPVTTHVLQDVKVIAVGDTPTMNMIEGDSAASLGIFGETEQISIDADRVVVEVTPSEVELLASAATYGALSLVLKRAEDIFDLQETEISLVELGTSESLVDRLNEIKLAERELATRKAELDKAEDSLKIKLKEFKNEELAFEATLKDFDQRVDIQQEELLQDKNQLVQKSRELKQLEIRLTSREGELRQKDAELQTLQKIIEERESVLAQEAELLDRDRDEFLDYSARLKEEKQNYERETQKLYIVNGQDNTVIELQTTKSEAQGEN